MVVCPEPLIHFIQLLFSVKDLFLLTGNQNRSSHYSAKNGENRENDERNKREWRRGGRALIRMKVRNRKGWNDGD